MSNRTTEGKALTKAICLYGLRQHPSQLTHHELEEQRDIAENIVISQAGVPLQTLLEAIQYGMNEVWPFSQQQYFDARDVRKSITKAKSVAAGMKRKGLIRVSAAEARRRDAAIRGAADDE